MSAWYAALAIAGVAVTAYLTRAAFFLLPGHVELSPAVMRALRHAPACALTAIVAPAVLAPGGEIAISAHNDRIWGVVAASLVFLRTKSMMAMMAAGLIVFSVLRLIGV